VQNPRIKAAAKLRERRTRDQLGHCLIDGAREIERAWQANVRLLEIFVCEELCHTSAAADLIARLSAAAAANLDQVTPPVFAKLAYGERAEGIIAVAETPRRALGDLKLPPDALVAVVEGCEKPGNLGAIVRSADGAGVAAVIAADPRTDLYNPNAIRASLGTIFALPLCAATSAETLHWLRERNAEIFAARVDGARLYTAANFRPMSAIVLGSEARGLSEVWQGPDITPIQLPMLGCADSLNVAATAAVLFYEAARQRASGD
jgi:TrmH family RNA methyltransferase